MRLALSVLFIAYFHYSVTRVSAQEKVPLYHDAVISFIPSSTQFLIEENKNLTAMKGTFVFRSSNDSSPTFTVRTMVFPRAQRASITHFKVLILGDSNKDEIYSSPLISFSSQSSVFTPESIRSAIELARDRVKIKSQIIEEKQKTLNRIKTDIEIINNTSKISDARQEYLLLNAEIEDLKLMEKVQDYNSGLIPEISSSRKSRWESELTQQLTKVADAAKRAERR